MKTLNTLLLIALFAYTQMATSQTADEIITSYIEVIGGQEAWSNVNSMKATGIGKQQGTDYPFTAYYMKNGKTMISVDLQGTNFVVEAFDGETGWNTNFRSLKAEAMDSEASKNYKIEAKDNIPSAFFNYKEKGYKVELLGKDSFNGTECYKLALTKTPLNVEDKEVDNVVIYYFDTENNVPIVSESVVKTGPAKGATSQTLYSNYQEVDGLYVPFSQIDKINDQVALEIIFNTVEFNSQIEESLFKMPVVIETED